MRVHHDVLLSFGIPDFRRQYIRLVMLILWRATDLEATHRLYIVYRSSTEAFDCSRGHASNYRQVMQPCTHIKTQRPIRQRASATILPRPNMIYRLMQEPGLDTYAVDNASRDLALTNYHLARARRAEGVCAKPKHNYSVEICSQRVGDEAATYGHLLAIHDCSQQ